MKKNKIRIPVIDPTQPIDYSTSKVPTTYVCLKCGASGVKLWRDYCVAPSYQTLLCAYCACREQKINLSKLQDDGTINNPVFGMTDHIGERVPAIPTKENDTFWGTSTVEEEGLNWWKNLPLALKTEAK